MSSSNSFWQVVMDKQPADPRQGQPSLITETAGAQTMMPDPYPPPHIVVQSSTVAPPSTEHQPVVHEDAPIDAEPDSVVSTSDEDIDDVLEVIDEDLSVAGDSAPISRSRARPILRPTARRQRRDRLLEEAAENPDDAVLQELAGDERQRRTNKNLKTKRQKQARKERKKLQREQMRAEQNANR